MQWSRHWCGWLGSRTRGCGWVQLSQPQWECTRISRLSSCYGVLNRVYLYYGSLSPIMKTSFKGYALVPDIRISHRDWQSCHQGGKVIALSAHLGRSVYPAPSRRTRWLHSAHLKSAALSTSNKSFYNLTLRSRTFRTTKGTFPILVIPCIVPLPTSMSAETQTQIRPPNDVPAWISRMLFSTLDSKHALWFSAPNTWCVLTTPCHMIGK